MTEPRKPRAPRKPVEKTPEPSVEPVAEEAVPEAAPAPAEPAPAPVADRRSPLALEFKRTLSQGDHGSRVDRVQAALAAAGYFTGTQDGRYGTTLARAVRRFQQDHGLGVTGSVNVATWTSILTANGAAPASPPAPEPEVIDRIDPEDPDDDGTVGDDEHQPIEPTATEDGGDTDTDDGVDEDEDLDDDDGDPDDMPGEGEDDSDA